MSQLFSYLLQEHSGYKRKVAIQLGLLWIHKRYKAAFRRGRYRYVLTNAVPTNLVSTNAVFNYVLFTIVDSTYVVSINVDSTNRHSTNVDSTNVVFTTAVFANAVSTNAIFFFSLQFHEYPWLITTSVPVMNTMIVQIIRTVSTLRGHTLALVRMDIMTCLDLIPCQAEFVQVI